MNYNDEQTEMQQIIETIRGYGTVMACITIGAILMFYMIVRISHM